MKISDKTSYLDDLIIIPALIDLALKLIPAEIMEAAREKAEKEPLTLRKNWTFGIAFIFVWLSIAYAMIKPVRGIVNEYLEPEKSRMVEAAPVRPRRGQLRGALKSGQSVRS